MNQESRIKVYAPHASTTLLMVYLGIIVTRWFHPATFSFTTEITVLSLALASLLVDRVVNIHNS